MVSAEEAAGAALLHSDVRRRMVDALANLPTVAPESEPDSPVRSVGMSAAQLAAEVGLHVTTIRFHLDQLEAAALVESHFVRQQGRGRPSKRYRIGSSPPSGHDPEALLPLTQILMEFFGETPNGAAMTPEQAGQEWAARHVVVDDHAQPAASPGQWLGKVGRAVDELHRWGYTANVKTSQEGRAVEIELRECPFIDVVKTRPDVVCGIHRGLLRGVLARLGEDAVDVSLSPLVEPNLCLASAITRTPFIAKERTSR